MILVDANLLVYAYSRSMPQHEAARTWLDSRLSASPPVGLPWPSLLAFVRLVSNPRVFSRPAPLIEAWQQVEQWLACPPAWIPGPTDGHAAVLSGLLPGLNANDVPDAHLAALALEHGLVVCSSDRGFARFGEVRWENPVG